MSDIKKRKIKHVELASHAESQMGFDPFARYQLPYRALPELSLAEVDTHTTLLGKQMSQPLIIASMTGGSEHARDVNTRLARAAELHQVALGVGSQRIALEHAEAAETFKVVRREAPTTVIFANMGAVQLNYGRSLDDCRRIVDMIEADALYLHVNPLQEAIQAEGDTDFSGLCKKIQQLVQHLPVPVFVKEVGHGLDSTSAQRLIECGVAGLDVAGTGGTSWAWIEAERDDNQYFAEWFKDFGIPTDEALQAIAPLTAQANVPLVASGGLRSPVQALKARLLGASHYSVALPFLTAALADADAPGALISRWQQGLQIALFSIGVQNWHEAQMCTYADA